jgi:hypothetical protein
VSGLDTTTTLTSITLSNTQPASHVGFIGQLFLRVGGTSQTITIPNTLGGGSLQNDYPSNTALVILSGGYATAMLLCDGTNYYLSFT